MRSAILITLLSLSLTACGKGAATKDTPADGRSASAASASSGAMAPAPEPVPDTLTVTVAPLAVGAKSEETSSDELKFKLTIDLSPKPAIDFTQTETRASVTRTEIMATDGKATTKARVTYVSDKKVVTKDGKDQSPPVNPRVGKTFVLELKDGKLVITDEKGKKAGKKEDAEVRRDNAHFGQPDPMTAALPSTPLKVGDKIPALGTALDQYFKDHDDGKKSKNAMAVSGVEVKLASVETPGPDAVGVFAITLTAGSPKDTKEIISLQMPLQGTMKVRARDGRILQIALGGPMTMTGTDPKTKISGGGDFKLTATTTY